jgi:hypothetical protein
MIRPPAAKQNRTAHPHSDLSFMEAVSPVIPNALRGGMTKVRVNLQRIGPFGAILSCELALISRLLMRAFQDSHLVLMPGFFKTGVRLCFWSLNENESQRFLASLFMRPLCLSIDTRRIDGDVRNFQPFFLPEMSDLRISLSFVLPLLTLTNSL